MKNIKLKVFKNLSGYKIPPLFVVADESHSRWEYADPNIFNTLYDMNKDSSEYIILLSDEILLDKSLCEKEYAHIKELMSEMLEE